MVNMCLHAFLQHEVLRYARNQERELSQILASFALLTTLLLVGAMTQRILNMVIKLLAPALFALLWRLLLLCAVGAAVALSIALRFGY